MRAVVHADDQAVLGLLQDVLAQLGFETGRDAGWQEPPALVLAHVSPGATPRAVYSRARAGTRAPIILVLPLFADERLVDDAIRVGADACYALGTPLAFLAGIVHSLVRSDG